MGFDFQVLNLGYKFISKQFIKKDHLTTSGIFVDPQGFEPQMTEPKSVVLPLHHGSLLFWWREIIKNILLKKVFFQ